MILEVVEGLQYQGHNESLAYSITTTPWCSQPSGVTVKAYLDRTDEDVTATFMTGSAIVAGDLITLPNLRSLTKGELYRIEVNFTDGDNDWSCYFMVKCPV